jgi:hypothetical protein
MRNWRLWINRYRVSAGLGPLVFTSRASYPLARLVVGSDNLPTDFHLINTDCPMALKRDGRGRMAE